ncbi:hypothetical protein KI387_019490 [Taxus chinensis]|uniref:Uncharacterized protein n=1 Tax=Taxus chinensis TaxID=29808 RepID=A0AA38LBJ3_TAXCH|nr:hypothetical protein KI387_019490 [Taxus chinensis]
MDVGYGGSLEELNRWVMENEALHSEQFLFNEDGLSEGEKEDPSLPRSDVMVLAPMSSLGGALTCGPSNKRGKRSLLHRSCCCNPLFVWMVSIYCCWLGQSGILSPPPSAFHFPMALPDYPILHLRGDKREVAFFSHVSQCRLYKIFRVGSPVVLKAIEKIITLAYLQNSSRARVNSEIANIFVSHLMLLKPVKAIVLSIAKHFIHSHHCIGLEESLENICIASLLSLVFGPNSSQQVKSDYLFDMKRRYNQLLQFAVSVHSICRSKGVGPSRVPSINVMALVEPIGPSSGLVPSVLRTSGFILQLSLQDCSAWGI